ncbi:gliding motility-associated C-terminal domain-containing protein [Dysgonomonas sp. Marseille-P4361]|uniref:gliding motility-associated C-terminal domain-containing protein n=1 Tax=Dysgonomonas sp. Marseille-P4361 TaxID=2161820 RepID=UPI000D552872|nr:gliding motility-associated C-terminal domain-containing protein [Dysgonomonas sp. Marseille-P4361]
MKKLLLLLLINVFTHSLYAQYKVEGGVGKLYEYTEDLNGAGIEKICLLNTLSGATITYTSSAVSVKFYRYKESLTDKEELEYSYTSLGNETTYVVSGLLDGYGYFVEENGKPKDAVWIIDYSQHQPELISIETIENEDKCENLKLSVQKKDELHYFSKNGAKRSIPRRYTLSYDKREWNAEEKSFKEERITLDEKEIGTEVLIEAPLVDTKFILEGDQFARHFNMLKKIESQPYTAIAVKAYIEAEQERRESNNEVGGDNELGGSAPVVVNFKGHGNEPQVAYYTWFIYNLKDPETPIARYTDKDIRYTFNEWGDYLVKLEVAEQSSMCVDTTSVSFSISESSLEVPNYFSPGDSPGSNDVFKVAYKSIVKFKCTIFNRWGTRLYQWTDPAKGWDGKYKGNYVNTGVYYYVIEAEGSEGKKYKLGGDINILRSR